MQDRNALEREALEREGLPSRGAFRMRSPSADVSAGDRGVPSNTVAEMLTCTIACATPRLLVPAPAPPVQSRYRWLIAPRSLARGFCSPAGLQQRPWQERVRRALAEDKLVLHYQPIVSLGDGRVSHYEALLRLADEPDGRLVAPARFLPAAERCGLIREIDRMVLEKVAEVLGGVHGEHGEHGVRIAMNLSAVSVTDRGMLADIERGLSRHGVDPSRLVIELTETASISDMERARAFCGGVQALGAAVALDDFGAGFGSLHYLKHLPFTYLKIDGDFIHGLPGSANDQLVVKALVGIVKGMGRETIAEFVDDQPTLGLLREYGVDYAQGFEFGRPQPALPLAA
jgi:EAL domain-containing protein (putative c-di-GMP-specific phosphodiesterase class I)